ncbi:MAG: hypothetical protein AB1458_01175 [Bacteroidota bacterium]
MKVPALDEKELAPYLLREDLIRQTAEQVKKDFGLHGLSIRLSGNAETAYQELYAQVEPYIARLLGSEYEKLLQLLYRIDVSEKRIADALSESANVSAAITRLIIFRELQKVVIRSCYSK